MTEHLPALDANQWMPCWTVRPGAFRAVRDLADATPLWQVIYSRHGASFQPCIHSISQLGSTINISRSTASRRLNKLRTAWLVFELPRGTDASTQIRRPPARWALDPFAQDHWRPMVEHQLRQLAEDDGQSAGWLSRALKAFEHFCRLSAELQRHLSIELVEKKRPGRKRPPHV